MKILILSKTLYGPFGLYCIGGISIKDNRYVRLLDEHGNYQPSNTQFEIGEVWEVEYNIPTNLQQPHVEDIFVTKKHFIKTIKSLPDYIRESGVEIWNGSINDIFESKLNWTSSGSGYISISDEEYPAHSVGFWVSDQPLNYDDRYFYYPHRNGLRRLVYKGVLPAIQEIASGTIIRVSLAKWWNDVNNNNERRCYAQLSGWY